MIRRWLSADAGQPPSGSLITSSLIWGCYSFQVCISMYIPCPHARYVLLNLCILRANTALQPAPSQNAARNIMRALGLCLVQMSDANGHPPEIMFSGAPKWVWGNPSAHVVIDGCKGFGKGSWGGLVKSCSRYLGEGIIGWLKMARCWRGHA